MQQSNPGQQSDKQTKNVQGVNAAAMQKVKFNQKKQNSLVKESVFQKYDNSKKKNQDLVFEDALLTQAYFSRYQIMDTSCTCVALMGVVLSAIEYELEYEERLNKIALVILWTIFISCILNAIFTIIRYNAFIDYKKVRNEYSDKANIFNTGLFFPCLVEFILVLIHPSPFLHNHKFYFVNDWAGPTGSTEVYYFYNEILSMLGIMKLFLVLRTILTNTKWYSNRSYRVCEMYGCEPSLLFICKCSMKYTPYTFICICYLVSILFFGFGVHITESTLTRGQETGFNSYQNSFWCIIVTMTTVGYGDFYPSTLLGRFLIFIVCIIGTFITSLMVLSLTNTLETSILENRAITVLDRLYTKKKRNLAAAKALTILAQFKIGIKKNKINNKEFQFSKKRKNLLNSIKEFSEYQEEYKQITDDNLIQEMQREFELIRKEMIILKKEQQNMIKKKIEIMKKYNMKQEIIDKFENKIDKTLESNPSDSEQEEISTEEEDIQQNTQVKSNYYKLTRQYTLQKQQSQYLKSQTLHKGEEYNNDYPNQFIKQEQQQQQQDQFNIQISKPKDQ